MIRFILFFTVFYILWSKGAIGAEVNKEAYKSLPQAVWAKVPDHQLCQNFLESEAERLSS